MKIRKWWENFIFCGLLTMIGLIIALKIDGNFWWIGALSGASLGYLLCDIKGLATAFSRSWKMAKGWKIDWRKVYTSAKIISFLFVGCIGCSLNLAVPLATSKLLIGKNENIVHIFVSATIAFFFYTLFIVFIEVMIGIGKRLSEYPSLDRVYVVTKKYLIPYNFFRVYFYLFPKGVWWCIKKTPHAILIALKGIYYGGIFVAKLLKHLCVFVHSEYRMTYATYIFIGITIGYLTDCSVATGSFAGGILGTIGLNVVPKYLPKPKLAPVNTSN